MSLHGIPARAGLAMVALLAASACSSTSLVNMWKDPSYPRQPLRNVLVVTLRKDAASRRIWEDGFVSALKAHGVTATPSYQLFPNADPDTTQLTDLVAHRGFDAVLVAHRTGVDTQVTYVPGYRTDVPYPGVSPWTGHYFFYYQRIYAPGYVEADRVVRYETDVWMTANGGRLVWSGVTESFNPSSTQDVNHEIASDIVPELVRQRIMASH
jgi:hypothetical protein